MVSNKIVDFISGKEVFATPEEVHGTQIFIKKLVEEYGYPKNNIRTRPQFNVRSRPSGGDKYPVDIAVFASSQHIEINLYGVVECKAPTKNQGVQQLKLYMDFSPAKWGVWFNGEDEPVFLRKIYSKDGGVDYKPIDDIPQYGKSLDEVGSIRKKDLKPTSSLKQTFNLINQHLYGNLSRTDTSTRSRASQMINLLFCKLYDERYKSYDDFMEFSKSEDDTPSDVENKIRNLFEGAKNRFDNVISSDEQIKLDKNTLSYIVPKLQNISLMDCSRDVIGEAFEVFVRRSLKGEEGQFFTPRNVVKFMVNYLNPERGKYIFDPGCGSGGFLIEAMKYLWEKVEKESKKRNWSKEVTIEEKTDLASKYIFGIDKDAFLSKITKIYMSIMGDGRSNIFCENSLEASLKYLSRAKNEISKEKFNYIFTNPPFGSKIPIEDEEILSNYELGHKWKYTQENGWEKKTKLVSSQPPQILFIERCVELLDEGGKLGIVLPEGIFGNPTDGYIWNFLKSKGKILGIISLPPETFQPYTHNKTSILFYEKNKEISNQNYNINFSIVKYVGHDKDGHVLYKYNSDGTPKTDDSGNQIVNDDLDSLNIQIKDSQILDYNKNQENFKIKLSDIKNDIFIPEYYIGVEKEIEDLRNDDNYIVKSIYELINDNIIYRNSRGYIPRGDEIGKVAYSLGNEIPFVRSSEISNWEINLETVKTTSIEIYEEYKDKQNIEEGDILLIKDGTYLIGRTAMVTELDTNIIIQSHIYQLKVLENDQLIDNYLLMYLLNKEIVQRQIKAITFVQGTISTIGNRIKEVKLPLPSKFEKRKSISDDMESIIKNRTDKRKELMQLKGNVEMDRIYKTFQEQK